MGQLQVMIGGDVRHIWDPDNEDEVKASRALFDELVGQKKYLAFRVGEKGEKLPEQIKRFDPRAQKIILTPPMAGG